jgi:hypothetical protein
MTDHNTWRRNTDGRRRSNRRTCNPGGCGGLTDLIRNEGALCLIESLKRCCRKTISADRRILKLAGEAFKDIHVFTDALNARHGKAESVQDYDVKSQMIPMKACARWRGNGDKYRATGVAVMLNNAWPSVIWHPYDFICGRGGVFRAKVAMEPLHPVYGYNDRSTLW